MAPTRPVTLLPAMDDLFLKWPPPYSSPIHINNIVDAVKNYYPLLFGPTLIPSLVRYIEDALSALCVAFSLSLPRWQRRKPHATFTSGPTKMKLPPVLGRKKRTREVGRPRCGASGNALLPAAVVASLPTSRLARHRRGKLTSPPSPW